MNYYYEIKLNFNETDYKFYEWSIKDKLECIKKIPLIRVKTKMLKDIVASNFKVESNFLSYIENKTICKYSKIKNACIFCDTKNCIAIEFDDSGTSISRSILPLEDDNNICEISYSLKQYNLDIDILNEIEEKKEFRQEEKIKRIIKKEVLELYDTKNYNKLDYLYYEWFNKTENDKEIVIKNMCSDLNSEFKQKHYEIYNIIKLSYNKI